MRLNARSAASSRPLLRFVRWIGRELSRACLPRPPPPAPLSGPAPPEMRAWLPESVASRRVGSARAVAKQACDAARQPEPLQDRVAPHGWPCARNLIRLDKGSSLDLGVAALPEVR